MNIILFTHPRFLVSQSMPRFADYLLQGMVSRGHNVEVWAPTPQFSSLIKFSFLKKWLGYIDQYVLFPYEVRRRLRACSTDTLFVFADQALGPWVPLVAHRPHVIHCHDFLAQRSALGEISENPTGWTGRRYQAFIRNGYTKGKCFISVSQTTREDLHRFLGITPIYSEVVYNGLNQQFIPYDATDARNLVIQKLKLDLAKGYLLHVGGNQWYKNRVGLIKLYDAWRASGTDALPLLLIGQAPDKTLLEAWNHSIFREDIKLLSDLDDELVRLVYAGATVFLFPSLAEGFGWPIAEAMAAGCPVITTAEAPMTEVGGAAAFYISRLPAGGNIDSWAKAEAQILRQVVELSPSDRAALIDAGLSNAARFDAPTALNQVEATYKNILNIFGVK